MRKLISNDYYEYIPNICPVTFNISLWLFSEKERPECELFVKNPVQQIFTVLKNEFFYQSFSNFHCSFNLTSNFFKVDRIPGVQLQIVENNQNHG